MKQCLNCGAEVPDTTDVCPICCWTFESAKDSRKYDDYYNDVEVIDKNKNSKRKTDSGVILKICLVAFGVIVSIATCITVLSLV